MKLKAIALLSMTFMVGLLSAQYMFGAFKIVTQPSGAVITLTGTNQNLGTTPSQVFPIFQDEYMEYSNGIPGRVFELTISRKGYLPFYQEIFVPFNAYNQHSALNNPSVFHFSLQKRYRSYQSYYYPPNPRPRHRNYLFNLYTPPPRHWNNHQGPNYYNPPQPPPSGSHGGQGSGGSYGGHGNQGGNSGGQGGNGGGHGGNNPQQPPDGGHGGNPRP